MNNIEEHIINSMKDRRSISKRPDIESILKHICNKNASNYTIFDIGKVLDDLKSKGKVENKPKKEKVWTQQCVGDEKVYETVNSES